jgi:DNA replication protein DnaC
MNGIPFEERRSIALKQAEEREREIWNKCPEIEAIDRELSETGMKVFRAALLPEDKREGEFSRLSALTASLKEKRKLLITGLGYDENYTSPVFHCKKCSDTGYVGHKLCDCYRLYLAKQRALSSGLGKALETQTFDTFRLDVYPEAIGSSRVRENMRDTLAYCRDYAEAFDGLSGASLLFVGKTGLGKTHLSSAIARRVIEKGFSVVYDSAQNLLAAFERDRFSQSEKKLSDKYFTCDLLIIDDLGTEIKGSTSLSYFYTLINSRLVASKSVIISTNLSPDALRRQYEDRVISRLFNEYEVFLFEGSDIRELRK